jgi:hypothetical protein
MRSTTLMAILPGEDNLSGFSQTGLKQKRAMQIFPSIKVQTFSKERSDVMHDIFVVVVVTILEL